MASSSAAEAQNAFHSILMPSSRHFPFVAHSKVNTSSKSLSSSSSTFHVNGRKYFLFGEHKHTLLAVSRVEVCVVPLETLANSLSFFRDLLSLTVHKYPKILYGDEEIIAAFHSTKQSDFDRKLVMRNLFLSKPRTSTSTRTRWV